MTTKQFFEKHGITDLDIIRIGKEMGLRGPEDIFFENAVENKIYYSEDFMLWIDTQKEFCEEEKEILETINFC